MTSRIASLKADLAKAKDRHRPTRQIERELRSECHAAVFASLPERIQQRLMRKWGVVNV